MKILGISGALNHDAAVALVDDGKILYASHAERYTGVKNDANLSNDLIRAAIAHGEPDRIVWYESPFKKKLRQLYAGQYSNAFDMNDMPKRYLNTSSVMPNIPIDYSSHHYSHAASGYYTSKFQDAAIVVVDSIGEFETITIWEGRGETLVKVYSQSYPHSLGLFYSAMTSRVGLKPQEDEYILMGMAAYGNPCRLYDRIVNDFGIQIDQTTKQTKNIISFSENLHRGCKWWAEDLDSEQDGFDIAAATQYIYQHTLRRIVKEASYRVRSNNLVIMGGSALNCSANSAITDLYKNVWIMPNPGDSGSCIGVTQQYFDNRIEWDTPYLGHDIVGEYPIDDILNSLYQGKICGIASGKAEFGPRALGNRTLTADPRGNEIKDNLNEIKKRQKFRPFAPMILEEDVLDYFEMPKNIRTSPYMQFVARCKFPDDFPAICHYDGTARVQTVNQDQHPGLYELLKQFKDTTGCPMLVNTSLNIKGKPIVNDAVDAESFEKHYGVKVHLSKR